MDNRDCGGVMANWFVAMTRLSGSAGFGVDYNSACYWVIGRTSRLPIAILI